MDESYYRTMLFDFYGELLTEKQREYFDLHYNEDLSLGEIAESEGVTRQAVWDIIRRAEEGLRRYEKKTGLVGRFARQRELLDSLEQSLTALREELCGRAEAVTDDMERALRELRHGI